MSETLLRIFECHLAMMHFLARYRRDNQLAHLAPFQGDLWETLSPGLKPRAESSCPFGVENPLQNLKLMLMGGCRIGYVSIQICALPPAVRTRFSPKQTYLPNVLRNLSE